MPKDISDYNTEAYIKTFVAKHNLQPFTWEGGYFYSSGYDHHSHYVITQEKPDHIERMVRGMIPRWAKPPKQHKAMVEAKEISSMPMSSISSDVLHNRGIITRCENALTEQYQPILKGQRCLIFANAFFDTRVLLSEKRIPYMLGIKSADGKGFAPFTLGGIYDYWLNSETGETSITFSMLTLAGNALQGDKYEWFHRMPLIIPEANQWEWLTTSDETRIKELMMPVPATDFIAHPVNELAARRQGVKNISSIVEPVVYQEVDLQEFL